VSAEFSGFEHMFFQDYVECYGLHDFETSMPALEHFTKFSSSEFAVRIFILQQDKRMMKQMLNWAKSDNHHVRRLASEGCRPRLPWAVSLPAFKKNPQPILPILKILMNDKSEYVRRSVANNLNDISKDNPDIVLDWAQQWLGDNENTDRTIKHACRTLLKQGDPEAMTLFGFTTPKHIKLIHFKVQPKVILGDNLEFSFLLKSHKAQLGQCRIEFAIDFVKANGSLSRKVFKITEGKYVEKEKQVTKYFSFKKISTRKYYAGKHQLTIIINGVDQISKSFDLQTLI
jgi:3-methyladenine DNA glycosylase AlkC